MSLVIMEFNMYGVCSKGSSGSNIRKNHNGLRKTLAPNLNSLPHLAPFQYRKLTQQLATRISIPEILYSVKLTSKTHSRSNSILLSSIHIDNGR